jgi:hypothetical protein
VEDPDERYSTKIVFPVNLSEHMQFFDALLDDL